MPKFEREVEIDAPVETVWKVMTDPNHWPKWFPGVDSVSRVTAVREGGSFEWVDEGQTGQGTIVSMEPLKRLEIITQMGDDKDSHVFVLRPTGGFLGLKADECKVEYTLDTLVGGGLLGNFVAGGNPKDVLRVKKAMHLLRKLVESLYPD
jgi:uncharacterized protein YndB with AHSA1/START domain